MATIEVGNGLLLREDERGVALTGDGMELRGDFSRMLPRLRHGALQRELLVRAARVRGVDAPTAVDATAGLGEDALLLAAAGFSVTLCEHDPVIAALLRDALRRAAEDDRLLAFPELRLIPVGAEIGGHDRGNMPFGIVHGTKAL